VDAAGQPTPGPFKFWRVTIAAWIRATWDACEESVGKESAMLGLLTACPAATLALRSLVKVVRSGGQLQGIRILLIPTQFPVPSGSVPAVTPKAGIKFAGTPRRTGTEETAATKAPAANKAVVYFIVI